jgi:dihydrofolate reductase
MRKLILFMHTSLDGFVAGPAGEMDWIIADDEMFEYAGKQTALADTALYGRVTFQMMDAYWPTAGNQPNATKHDKEHAAWYNNVQKVVMSKTLDEASLKNTTVVRHNAAAAIRALKNEGEKNILVFGSPGAAHTLIHENLVDEYWLFVNPIILGAGIPLFPASLQRKRLHLMETIVFKSGVVCLHYEKA